MTASVSTVEACGIITDYSYDGWGNLTNIVYSDDTPTVSLKYDALGRQIEARDAAGVTTFIYDSFGSVTNETVIGVAGTNTIERSYDNFGRLQYNSDLLLHYGENGLLVSVSNHLANAKYRYAVNNIDEGCHIAVSDGIALDRTLARDFVRDSTITNITSAIDGTTIENLKYKSDVLNRPIFRNEDAFGYNDRSEVVSATIANISKVYRYDEIGNSSFFEVNGLNQYSEYEYDSDGNHLSCSEHTFVYDGENRLSTVLSNGVPIVSNHYDAKSRRVKKVTPEAITTFFYDDWNLIEERIAYANGTTSTIKYYWGKDLSGTLQGACGVGGLLYLTISNFNSELQLYIPCYDNNGNITKYVDANGNVVTSYTYDAFGKLIAKSGALADFFHHRFSTRYFDVETELYYYGYRFYSPYLMRWLNRDPIEENGGLNLYGFCGNNSVVRYDNDGRAYFAVRGLGSVLTPVKWSNFVPCPFMKIAVDVAANMLNVELLHEQLFYEDGSNIGWGNDDDGLGVGKKIRNEPSNRYKRRDGGYNDCVMRIAESKVSVDHYQLTWVGGRTKCNCQDYADMLRAKYRELKNDPEVKCKCGLK